MGRKKDDQIWEVLTSHGCEIKDKSSILHINTNKLKDKTLDNRKNE